MFDIFCSRVPSRFGLHSGINFGLYAIPFICCDRDNGDIFGRTAEEKEAWERLDETERSRRILSADPVVWQRLRDAVLDMAEAGII